MSGATDSPSLVQAIYSFKGKNNDELCFKKGDIITLTQKEEGGWWEGTLGEKTGWFPSNYVKEYKPQDGGSPTTSKMSPSKLPPEIIAQQKAYRNLVLKDLIDSEKANVAELQGLLKNFLHPLEKSEILTKEEYRQLVGNIGCVVETHQQLLASLEECSERSPPEQRVGRVFLSSAPRVKQVHQSYCASHPRAVCILDKYKDELNTFMEAQGAASPGLLVLTTGLSKPFRRLEKYAGMLQELERHVEENHPDRGDTQRSVSVYKDIASACSATRRQKELELEVLTGGVRGWEGEDLACLGDILHMGSVAVGPEHRDRYLVLFPSTLLILSVSQRMSAFIYEGKLPLTAITVNKLEDTDALKNAFEIAGPMIERIVAVCQTREDQQQWVDQLRQQIRMLKKSSSVSSPPPVSPPAGKPTPLPSPHVSALLCPYSHLAAHFAELVKQGVITRKILKKLLYSVFTDGVSLTGVRLRRVHKVECTITPQRVSIGTNTACITYIESDSSSTSVSGTSGTASSRGWKSGTLVRQDAVDFTNGEDRISSSASGPCGLICFYEDSDSCDESPVVKKSISVFGEVRNNSQEKIEKRATYQIPQEKSRYKSGTTIHLEPKNPLTASEQSGESSSFERTSAHKSFPGNVCEDLSNLNEYQSITNKNILKPKVDSLDTRQSMPAPRRCRSTVQVSLHSLPNHVSVQEIALGTRLPADNNSPNPSSKTHSSTLDIPALMPAPSALLAELMYNSDFHQTDKYETLPRKHKSNNRYIENSPLGHNHKYQQDMDQKQSRIRPSKGRKMRGLPKDGSLPLRKTYSHSSSCHHSNSNVSTDSAVNPNDSSCHLCQRDMPCSSRSSDSGLADIAGNSILPSPDFTGIHGSVARSESCPRNIGSIVLPHSLTLRESSEVDESNFEAQCICTSPFGSTPRTSAQPSLTSGKVFVGSSDSATQSITSLSLSPSPVSTSQSQSPDPVMNEQNDNVGTFRSGMYAHWWLKARLPVSALTSSRPASVCSCHSCFSCTEECRCSSAPCECPSCQQCRQPSANPTSSR